MNKTQRLKEIINIFTKYGLSIVGNKIKNHSKSFPLTDQQILQLFSELGPTFIKFGQFLSTRPDLVDEKLLEVLRNLQDNVPGVSFTECKKFIEDTFQENYFDYFQKIDPHPQACASIAQVYRGTLKNGQEVVLKIKRPGIDETITTDLEVIKKYFIVQLKAFGLIPGINLENIYTLFELKIKEELDFYHELYNLKIFRKALKDEENLIVPKAFEDLSGRNILVMEYIEGNLLTEFLQKKVYYPALGEKLVKSFCRLLLINNLFHGDPHPGNIVLTQEKKICFLDFGAVGFIDQKTSEILAELFLYLDEKNVNGIINIIYRLGQHQGEIDDFTFYQEIYKIVELVSEIGKGEVLAGRLIIDIIKISIKYGINVPANLFFIGKAALSLESTAFSLGTRLNLFKTAKNYSEEALILNSLKKLEPSTLLLNFYRQFEMSDRIPSLLYSLLRKFDEGSGQLIFKHAGLESIIKALDRTSMRITLGLIIASLLIASGLIVAADGQLLKALGTTTYILSILASIYLIYLIFKSGKWR